jgi:hypothetical protein
LLHGDRIVSDLVSQDGKLVVRDGKLGTGQGCCCGGGGQTCGCNGLEDGLPCTFYFPDCVSNPDAAVGYSWDPFFSGGAGNGQGSFVIPIFGGWKEDYPYPAFGSCRYLVVTTFQASPSGQAARIWLEDCVAREWLDVTEEAAADIDALSSGVPPDPCVPAMVCFCPDADLDLEFTSSCFGSGAVGTATIAGGVVTSASGGGGTGYAKLGRVEPVLSITASHTGSNATFTPTFSGTAGVCSPPVDYFAVSSISVTGGSGYTNNSSLTISVTQGTQVQAATAKVITTKVEPTLSLSGNATVQITLSPSGAGWTISGVSVTNGGSGYAFDDFIYVNLGANDQEVVAAELYAITDSGSDVLTGVDIYEGGEYFKYSGTPESVEITNGGSYFLEDSTKSPYVSSVTVTITQAGPSSGSGANITATVNSDTASANFGKISSLSVTSGGSGYQGICNPLP